MNESFETSKQFKVLFLTDGLRNEVNTIEHMLTILNGNIRRLTILALLPKLKGRMRKYANAFDSSVKKYLDQIYNQASQMHSILPDSVDYEQAHFRHPMLYAIKTVIEQQYDYLVKQVHKEAHDPGIGAEDMTLLRKNPNPTLLLREYASKSDYHVGVAIDLGSEDKTNQALSINLLKYANQLALQLSCSLSIISCWESELEKTLGNPFINITPYDVEEESNSIIEDQKRFFNQLVQEAEVDVSYNFHHFKGHPAQQIPKATIEYGIDLLVMGTVGRTGLPGYLIGNTSENILHKLDCSILAIKPEGFETPVKTKTIS